MAINNDRNLLEQRILSNSGLKGKELENLKARLATLSEQQLQAELSKLLSGNNKGEWYTGITLEHSESVVIKSNHETTTFTDENGNVSGMKCIKMELGEPDESGRRSPIAIEGSEFVMDVDTVIMSLGTSPNPLISSHTPGLEVNKRKCLVAEEETGLTTREAVYAGGDAVTGAATVILAMGAGKKAAAAIDEYLSK